MSEENVSEENNSNNENTLLARVKEDLYDQNIVAFLGPPNSGKTVIATLLNDSIFTRFREKHGDDYETNMTDGFEFLRTTRKVMLDGKFPSTTLPNNEGEVVFKIARKGPLGKATQLRIRDISGEDYESLLIFGDLDAEKRIDSVLRRHKTRSMRYGPLSFIVVAKMYIIMIDCSEYSKWKELDLDYARLLNSLSAFQKVVDGNDSTITSSIAIILTKTDCLPDEVNESARELLASQMPQFDQTLNVLHKGTREYFELSIDLDRTASNEQNQDGVKVPWSYSSDEYSRLILWILDNISR